MKSQNATFVGMHGKIPFVLLPRLFDPHRLQLAIWMRESQVTLVSILQV